MQAGALFWVLVCFFRVGAMTKALPMNRWRWFEIAQLAAICTLLFGLLTDWRGVRVGVPHDSDGARLILVQPVEYSLRHIQGGGAIPA